jgi:hypothetical protein
VDVPVATIVPTVELPPAIPLTFHATPIDEPETSAVKTWAPAGTLTGFGDTVTTIESSRVTTAEELASGLAWLTAVTETFACDGKVAGAVYTAVPDALGTIVPKVEFPPTTPFTSHVTFVFELPETIA